VNHSAFLYSSATAVVADGPDTCSLTRKDDFFGEMLSRGRSLFVIEAESRAGPLGWWDAKTRNDFGEPVMHFVAVIIGVTIGIIIRLVLRACR